MQRFSGGRGGDAPRWAGHRPAQASGAIISKMQTNLDVEFKKPTYYFDTRPRAMVNANKCPKSDLNLEFEII